MMSEKIVITVEQEDAIRIYKEAGHDLTTFAECAKAWTSGYKSIKDLSIDQMARILYEPNSYEVERPRVKVGEWATNTECNITFKVYAVTDKRIVRIEDSCLWDKGRTLEIRWYSHEHTRPATKEEIFWAELGREVGEFVDDDLIVTDDRNLRVVTMQGVSGSAKKLYENGSVTGFYPANSFIKLP